VRGEGETDVTYLKPTYEGEKTNFRLFFNLFFKNCFLLHIFHVLALVVSFPFWPFNPWNLAGWPGELTSSNNMDMQVVHRLTSFNTVVDHHPVSLSQSLFLGTLLRHQKKMTEQAVIILASLTHPASQVASSE